VRAGPATSTNGSHALPDGLSASFERIINEQREHELIVFGLPKVSSENCTETITKVSSSLDVSVSLPEIARALAQIPSRNSSSSPLIIKFTTIAKRNELIARARQGGMD